MQYNKDKDDEERGGRGEKVVVHRRRHSMAEKVDARQEEEKRVQRNKTRERRQSYAGRRVSHTSSYWLRCGGLSDGCKLFRSLIALI